MIYLQLQFGERNFVKFNTEEEFYEALGFLSNPSRGIRFDWESYNNKWGIEGRIWIRNSSNAPTALQNAFSAGTNSIDHRLNCNEYILYLIRNFGIVNGSNNDVSSIRRNVPSEYLDAFDRGYNL